MWPPVIFWHFRQNLRAIRQGNFRLYISIFVTLLLTRHGYDSFFDLIQLNLRKFWFRLNSWLPMAFGIWFKSTYDSNGSPEFGFKSTHDSKIFPEFCFKSTHESKSFTEFWFRSTHDSKIFWNIDSNQLITQLYLLLIQCRYIPMTLWLGLGPIGFHSVWPFLGFRLKCLPRNWFESTRDSISISKSWINSAHDHTWARLIFSIRLNSALESFDSDSTHDSQRLSKINSNQLTTQNGFLEYDSNRFMTTHCSKSFTEFWFK